MAERRPLVLVNGEVQELPIGDTTPGSGGGGGSRTIESATITLPNQSRFHEQVIVRAGTTAAQKCQVWLAPTVDSDDNDVEFLEGYNLDAKCETGQIRFFWRSVLPESGAIKLNYEVI